MKRESIAESNPELLAEWNYEKNYPLDPSEVTCGSTRSVWWKGRSCGHEWKAEVHNRARGTRCPYCTGRKLFRGFNDLKSRFPEIAAEWHPEKNGTLTAEDVMPFTGRKVWWRGNACGHVWQTSVDKRTKGSGCPYCSGAKVLVGFNDLATVFPDIAEEWSDERNGDLNPESVTAFSCKSVWWECKNCGYVWKNRISHRAHSNGCPVCAQFKACDGINDLATVRPDLAAEWAIEQNGDLKPTMVTPYSHKSVWWFGTCGHSWKSTVYARSRGSGCPFCSGMKVLAGDNDLASNYPDIAKEWNDDKNGKVEPTMVTAYSHKKVWWKGSCGHEWESSVFRRTQGDNCPICAGRRVLAGYNDLLSLFPDVAAEWDYDKNDPLTPDKVIGSSQKRYWWKGKECGHEWQARIDHRVKGNGCPYCSGHRPIKGVSDLLTVNPQLAAEWNDERNGMLRPTEVTSQSHKQVWWRGQCGHEWKSAVYVRARGTGCPFCTGKKREHKANKGRMADE